MDVLLVLLLLPFFSRFLNIYFVIRLSFFFFICKYFFRGIYFIFEKIGIFRMEDFL